MLRIVSTLTLGLLALSGCPGDDTGTTAAGSTTDPGDTTVEPGTTNPGTTIGESADTTEGATTNTPGTTTDDPPGTTTDDPPGTTTDEPGTTTDEPGTTTDEPGGVCDADPADDECATCVKSMCCTELEGCDADPSGGCQCFQECAQMNPGIAGAIQCGNDCGVNPLGAGTPTGDLGGCTQQNCGVGICI